MAGAAKKQPEKAIALIRKQGIARLSELMSAGVSQETVARLSREGRITRLARGLYQLPDAELATEHSLAEVCKLVPKGVICLVSALQFHDLTVQLPRAIWVAIGSSAWMPRVTHPPMRFVRFGDVALSEGIEKHKIEGVTVRVTDPAYTIADCFRFRSKVGVDVALEGMREALRRKLATADAIMLAAQRRRIWTKLRPYLEATLDHAG
jgi:predicted transcriptional regulator of viral defense system